jgi:hypothetical protein
VFQEEGTKLRESVPYVKIYRYNPKHLYPKLNGYEDNNAQRSLKLWQLLLTYWLPNTHWNWQEYVVSVMLISVRNIKLTCEWYKAIKLNYKKTRTHIIVVLKGSTHYTWQFTAIYYCSISGISVILHGSGRQKPRNAVSWQGTVRRPARRPHFSLAIISVTVQLWIQVFWVISVYFNIRNTLLRFCPFLLGHPVYTYC